MPKRLIAAQLVLLVSAQFALPASILAARALRAPASYQVQVRRRVAPGLTHIRMVRSRGPRQVVHVAKVAPGSNLTVQPVPSRGNLGKSGPSLERTSTLCRRVHCLAAINGDFFRHGQPVGGLILDGKVVKAPRNDWVQAAFDGDRGLVARRLRIRASLVTTDLKRMRITRVDRENRRQLSLFTRASGRRTPKGRGVAAVLRVVKPRGSLRVGQTSIVRLKHVFRGGKRVRIPARGAVLAGRGSGAARIERLASAMRSGAISRQVLLRLESNPKAWDAVGGRPVIVRNGRSVVGRRGGAFARGRHPRTLLGRTRDGSILMATVDGRQPGRSGMSLAEAARLMVRLGADEAINLDGGGSTTFVLRGRVRNKPSDGRERPVAVALALVRKDHGVAAPRVPQLSRLHLARVRPTPAPRPGRLVQTLEPGVAPAGSVGNTARAPAGSTPVTAVIAAVLIFVTGVRFAARLFWRRR
ncbi:MAG TPA: phosphodiester glycosidase family protein [Actinomycetota bacterium]